MPRRRLSSLLCSLRTAVVPVCVFRAAYGRKGKRKKRLHHRTVRERLTEIEQEKKQKQQAQPLVPPQRRFPFISAGSEAGNEHKQHSAKWKTKRDSQSATTEQNRTEHVIFGQGYTHTSLAIDQTSAGAKHKTAMSVQLLVDIHTFLYNNLAFGQGSIA